ncbi:hypothetical protein [Lacinutrix sp.]|uniref:hypothetical protein n=1 Tax=Lacinutrix sp. TaxID=1937692 RepID=UPI0025C2B8E2|nr:hypothetical protein [Lacinutrix sp.]
MNNQTKYKINLKYTAICNIAVLLTFFFHEGAHFIMGEILGYDMWMNLNSANIANGGNYSNEWENQLVSAAGPLFTIAQAILFFIIINKSTKLNWYPFLFVTALMRSFAAVISATIMANDEARVSEWLGIGKMTLPIIVSVFLIGLLIKTSRKQKISWKFNLITFLLISINIIALVYINQYYL